MANQDGEQPVEQDLPREGDVLAGKYRIDRVLGQGGMGVVVAAHHTTLRQKVAVKFLLPAAAKRGDATERFLREARASVSIQSEHVARVTDVGTLDTGAPYMVMEFLSGSDLGELLERQGMLPVETAVDYVLQACEAIAEAHSLGIIHRDLKPANLFLATRADGSSLVKVLDFGLSKATKPDAMDASLTAAHVVMGSPYYMSPEQIRSFKSIDARADIWSVGVILYQLLTGVCPFEHESLGALFMAIGADPAPSICERRPEVPAELEAVVLKCLVKDVKGRTQTIAELARGLAPFGAADSHISVERILRVLSDPTPFTRPSHQPPPAHPSSAPPAPPHVGLDATLAAPPRSRVVAAQAPDSAPPASAASGSMPAMSVTTPPIPLSAVAPLAHATPGTLRSAAEAESPKRRTGGIVAGVLAVAALGVVGVGAWMGVFGSSQRAAVSATALPAVTAAATVAPTSGATAPAAASEAPAVSVAVASASASAPVVTPEASPDAGVLAKGRGGKVVAPAGSSPKLSRPVSAALKHGETFE